MSSLPDWFDINNYSKLLPSDEWAYEIWVRAHFFQHESLASKAEFKIQKEMTASIHLNILFGGLPAVIDNYKAFLRNKRIFDDYYMAQKTWWEKIEKDKPAIYQYENTDIYHTDELTQMPDLVDKNDVDVYLSNWCYRAQPIGINLEKTDSELIKAFKEYLRRRRDEEKKYLSLSKNVSEKISTWHETKLLAQFDLLLWREAFDNKLTYNQIAQAIWPEEYSNGLGIEQNLRKHAKSKFEAVFSIETAKALHLNC